MMMLYKVNGMGPRPGSPAGLSSLLGSYKIQANMKPVSSHATLGGGCGAGANPCWRFHVGDSMGGFLPSPGRVYDDCGSNYSCGSNAARIQSIPCFKETT